MTIRITRGRSFLRLAAAVLGVLLLSPTAFCQIQVDSALSSLLSTDPNTFWLNLDRSRPPAVTADFKDRVLHDLPEKGEIKDLSEPARRKLASLGKILRLHQRELVYEIKVIDVPHAFVGLHARSVLLISEPALNLLNSEELQATVAHEVGHEYVLTQYEAAWERKDFRRMQQLELFCDGVSIVTLRKAGVDPARLVSAVEKMVQFKKKTFKPGPNEDHYTLLDERKKFAKAVMAWAAVIK
jgi:predicted Zn-dependent protease